MANTDFRVDVIIDPKQAGAGARSVENSLTSIDRKAAALRSRFTSMLGVLAGGALITSSIRTLAQFEQAIATVAGVSGATGEQLDALRQKALDLGISTRFTATQAADALVSLSRAGFTATESLTAVGDTLLLAQAGALGLEEATDIAASTLRGFRLEADQAARVADVLSATANSTNTSVGQLGEGMKFVAPVAAGLKVPLELAAAAMGTLSDAGLKGSLAGTGLRRVLSELESPSLKTAEILGSLGIRTNEVRISQVGLAAALDRLKEAGLDTGQALEVFGDRGGPAFEVLSANLPKVLELDEKLQSAAGTARRTADIMDDNLNGALLRAKSAFEGLILNIGGSGATGGLRNQVEQLAVGLRFLAENSDVIVQSVRNLAIFLGPRYLLGALRAITILIAANPLGLLLTAMSLVIALVPDLQAKLDSLVSTLTEVGTAFVESFDVEAMLADVANSVDGVIALFNGLLAASGAIFDALSTQPEAAAELMKKGFRDAVEATLDYFFAFAQTVGQLIIGLGEDVIGLARNVGGAIGAISSGNLEAAQTFADNLESTLLRSANRVTTFTGTLSGNLKKLRDTELLPEVELGEQGFKLGNLVYDEFTRAISESVPSAKEALDRLLGREEDVAAEAARRAKELPKVTPKSVDTPQSQAAQISAESSQALGDGFSLAFLKIKQEAEDLAAVGEAVVNTFADNATDALTEFITTGQFNFKQFAQNILADLARIIARLLVVQALNAVFGGGGGGLAAGAQAGVQLAGARAEGGPVSANRSYLVGEKGPELFTPSSNGNIVPNSALGAAATPEVNLQVVNVDDPNKVPQAIASGIADQQIINVLGRNRDAVKQTLS